MTGMGSSHRACRTTDSGFLASGSAPGSSAARCGSTVLPVRGRTSRSLFRSHPADEHGAHAARSRCGAAVSDPVRVLVVDDHPVVREGLVAMLQTQPDLEVIGEAANGAEAVRAVTVLTPDVVLLDLEMPEMDGVEVLQIGRAHV